MIDPVTGMAISAGVNALGGYLGDKAAAGDRRRAEEERRRQTALINGLEVPDIESLQYDPTMSEYVGDVTAPDIYIPETATNAYEDITVNPELAGAQMQALGSFDQIIEGGGLTDMDRLNAARAQQAAQQNASMQAADIQQDMARRGMGGSGQELLSKLVGSQGAVNRAAEQEQALQAQARDRALNAIMQKGNMATGMRGQQSAEDQAKADAANAINQFNISGATSQQNLGNQQQLQAAINNQGARQGVNNLNANSSNIAKGANVNAVGNQYEMEKGKVGLQTNQMQNNINDLNNAADRTAKKYTAGADFLNSGISKYTQQPKKKG